jgi:hypothetical protein
VEPEAAAAEADDHVSRRQNVDRITNRRIVMIVVEAIVEDPVRRLKALALMLPLVLAPFAPFLRMGKGHRQQGRREERGGEPRRPPAESSSSSAPSKFHDDGIPRLAGDG